MNFPGNNNFANGQGGTNANPYQQPPRFATALQNPNQLKWKQGSQIPMQMGSQQPQQYQQPSQGSPSPQQNQNQGLNNQGGQQQNQYPQSNYGGNIPQQQQISQTLNQPLNPQSFQFQQQQQFNQVPFNYGNQNQQQYYQQQQQLFQQQQQQAINFMQQKNPLNNNQQQNPLYQNGQFISNKMQNPNQHQGQQQFQQNNLNAQNISGSAQENEDIHETTKFKLLDMRKNIMKQSGFGESQNIACSIKQKQILDNTQLVEIQQIPNQDKSEYKFILKNINLDKLCFKKLCFIVQFLFMAIQELDKKRTTFWKELMSIFEECKNFRDEPCYGILQTTMSDFKKIQENNTLRIEWLLSALQSQISTFGLSVLSQFFIKAHVEKDPSLTAASALIKRFSQFCIVKVEKDVNQFQKQKSTSSLPMSVIYFDDSYAAFVIFSSKS